MFRFCQVKSLSTLKGQATICINVSNALFTLYNVHVRCTISRVENKESNHCQYCSGMQQVLWRERAGEVWPAASALLAFHRSGVGHLPASAVYAHRPYTDE